MVNNYGSKGKRLWLFWNKIVVRMGKVYVGIGVCTWEKGTHLWVVVSVDEGRFLHVGFVAAALKGASTPLSAVIIVFYIRSMRL